MLQLLTILYLAGTIIVISWNIVDHESDFQMSNYRKINFLLQRPLQIKSILLIAHHE